ncbi:MAG: PIN domain-containing protein [Desulfobacterales bacterium]|nr:MAG: PIN domain-containing protein [Desulfobacterales bacterium]
MVTNKLQPGMDPQSAREDGRFFLVRHPIPVHARVVEEAWHIRGRYKLSWWDALIVSAAQVSDCRYLLTEDLQENWKMGNVEVINPFPTPPESL